MILGYHSNGLSNHTVTTGVSLLESTGYRSVALMIDHNWLSPRDPASPIQLQQIKYFLNSNGISSVIETGARFLLDPNSKYAPSLLDRDPDRVEMRMEFYRYCIDIGVELGSHCVSIWSGIKPEEFSFNTSIEQLVRNLAPILKYADERKIDIAFEPEPNMLIDNTGRFERLLHLIDSPRLKLTLDIGNLFYMTEVPIANYIEKWADRLANVHISDMKPSDSEHQPFGEGQIYFPPVLESLHGIGYSQGIHVELDRQSDNAAEMVKQSYEFLAPIIKSTLEEF